MKKMETLKYSLTVESLREISTKRRSKAFGKLIDSHSVTDFKGKSISSISMWNIVNQ